MTIVTTVKYMNIMKKLLFTLFSAVTLFSSCSGDEDSFIDSGLDNKPNEKKYTVNFNIKSDGFDIDKRPLRSINDYNTYLQIVVYNEAGNVYSNTILREDSINKEISNDGSFPFSLQMPRGNYYIAFIHNPYITKSYEPVDYFEKYIPLNPVNYYTDQEEAAGTKGYMVSKKGANYQNYYTSISVTIDESDKNESFDVVLDPMWSNVYIALSDVEVPIYANYYKVDIVPSFHSYSIETKLATINVQTQYLDPSNDGYIPVEAIERGRLNAMMTVSKTNPENNNLKFTIEWLRGEPGGDDAITIKEEIDVKTQLENGLNYKIVGSHKDFSTLGDSKMKFSITSFYQDSLTDTHFNDQITRSTK